MLGLIMLLVAFEAGAADCVAGKVDSGDRGLSGAGGGSIGDARPSRMAFLRAATS